MGAKTKIDWCDSTWNPVTGCQHGCEYCYARGIANRFGRKDDQENVNHDLKKPLRRVYRDDFGVQCLGSKLAYPYGFDPTFHRYKLDEPQKWKKPRTIFVCSMADLFGEWVPDEWIIQVFEACRAASWHRYIFLSKNPKRYSSLYTKGILPAGDGFWYGTTTTEPGQPFFRVMKADEKPHIFISIDPILKPFGEIKTFPEWVIIGAETGNRRGKANPSKEWIDEIAQQARAWEVPVFMKESLRSMMGDDFRQEFPWEAEA